MWHEVVLRQFYQINYMIMYSHLIQIYGETKQGTYIMGKGNSRSPLSHSTTTMVNIGSTLITFLHNVFEFN
jgi:hypothetical protein